VNQREPNRLPHAETHRAAASGAAFSGATDCAMNAASAIRSARSDAGGVVAARQPPPKFTGELRFSFSAPGLFLTNADI